MVVSVLSPRQRCETELFRIPFGFPFELLRVKTCKKLQTLLDLQPPGIFYFYTSPHYAFSIVRNFLAYQKENLLTSLQDVWRYVSQVITSVIPISSCKHLSFSRFDVSCLFYLSALMSSRKVINEVCQFFVVKVKTTLFPVFHIPDSKLRALYVFKALFTCDFERSKQSKSTCFFDELYCFFDQFDSSHPISQAIKCIWSELWCRTKM